MSETVEQKEIKATPIIPGRRPFIWGTGRRKTAVARVRLSEGSGKVTVNGRQVEVFFTEVKDRNAVYAPLEVAGARTSYDVLVNVNGGGITGQAFAIRLGVARALLKVVPEKESELRNSGFLTRDSRMKERKKYGQKGARKRFQFSKR